jgi:hypothetical protein
MNNQEQSNLYGQNNFNLPHDVVELPSKGKFYKSKKKTVKIGYLTANDENILASWGDGQQTENIIFNLIRAKLYEPDLKPEEMLFGDIEAILIFLRNTSFGPEYEISLVDPQTSKKFTTSLILDELSYKTTKVEPNENGHFETVLPKSNVMVRLKPTTLFDELELNKQALSYPTGRVAPKITWRLMKQIVDVDGNSDREFISKFIESMPIADSKYIKNFLKNNEPGLDLEKKVLSPSGEVVSVQISFGVEFFRPFF